MHSNEWLKPTRDCKDSPFMTIHNAHSAMGKDVGNIHLLDGFNLKNVLNVLKFKWNLLYARKLTHEFKFSLPFFLDTCFKQYLYLRNFILIAK